jgi:hypothetical protein
MNGSSADDVRIVDGLLRMSIQGRFGGDLRTLRENEPLANYVTRHGSLNSGQRAHFSLDLQRHYGVDLEGRTLSFSFRQLRDFLVTNRTRPLPEPKKFDEIQQAHRRQVRKDNRALARMAQTQG